MKRLLVLVAVGVAFAVAPSSALAADECDGLEQCVPVHGPWVVVPTTSSVPRPQVEWQLRCPSGYIVGGLDAELSDRAIDVGFLGMLGSPVNPGISTGRSAVFIASYVGATARAPTFRPHIGCIPAAGGGRRIPTAVSVFKPGEPTVRRVAQVRIRPGSRTVSRACAGRETLVDASHAFGFFRRTPPAASLIQSVRGRLAVRGRRAAVAVTADAELGDVRAVVQVHAVCSRVG